jgi:hypothetical protein
MRVTSTIGVSAAALFAAIVCTVAARAVGPVKLPPGLEARYHGLLRAFEKRDFKTYDTFYSPDYVSVDASGKATHRAEYMASVKDLLNGATTVSTSIRYTGVRTHQGMTEVSFDFSGKIVKVDGVTAFHEVGTDTWQKSGATWMETKTVDSLFTVTSPKTPAKK